MSVFCVKWVRGYEAAYAVEHAGGVATFRLQPMAFRGASSPKTLPAECRLTPPVIWLTFCSQKKSDLYTLIL